MKVRTIVFTLIGVVIAIVIFRKVTSKDGSAATNSAAAAKNQQLLVSAYIVKPQNITDKIISSGTVVANEQADVKNEIAGRVVHIYFKEGSKVKKGNLLVKIFDSDLQAQLKKLQLQEDLAEKNEGRMRDLLKIQGISQQDYDAALNAVNSAKADIELVRTQIDKTNIPAPFDGIVGLRTVSEGAFLMSNTRIASIQEINPLKIDFTAPERYMNQIQTGDEISFTVSGSTEIFKGSVYAIEPSIDLSTRSLTVRALCPNNETKILPGAFAHIEVPLKKINNAIMIPTEAVIPQLKGQKVFVVRNGAAANKEIETGLRNDSTIQVTSGLQPGDSVLITGLLAVRPDMPVKVTSVK